MHTNKTPKVQLHPGRQEVRGWGASLGWLVESANPQETALLLKLFPHKHEEWNSDL